MSVGGTPSLNFIGDTVGDVAPHAMSEMRGIRFLSGNSPKTGAISLGDFRNQVLTTGWLQPVKIQSSDIQDNDNFGYSVSISGDGNTALVGVPREDTGAEGAGTAYTFTRSGTTWTQQAKFQASDRQLYDNFGTSVSISSDGNTAIVGAESEDTGGNGAGAAYIFTRSGTTWTQQAKIQSSDIQGGDYFGRSDSISGDGNTALVGAYGEDTGGSVAGAAYIFTRSGTTWTQQAKIMASDKQSNDQFGYSVAISSDGNTAIVGAWREDTGGADAGAAYIFTRSGTTWTQRARIQVLYRQGGDLFGTSVSISSDGNTAIVGAYGNDNGAGAAYIFTRSGTTWTQQAKIVASDKQPSDFFGWSVSISGDGNTALVGAYYGDAGVTNTGAAYIFTRSGTTWTQQQKIQASDADAYDVFGTSVSISSDGNTAIVGASYQEDTGGTDAGAAYIIAYGGYYT